MKVTHDLKKNGDAKPLKILAIVELKYYRLEPQKSTSQSDTKVKLN